MTDAHRHRMFPPRGSGSQESGPKGSGPSVGQFVSLRGRLWMVEAQPDGPFSGHRLACIDDDASGEDARILWNAEIDARLHDEDAWATLGTDGGDAATLSAYLRTVRWRTATAAERDLFQAPFRAGTFLDAVLRCGDSLVGLPTPKIVAVTWDKVSGQHGFIEAIVREGIDAAAQLRRLMRSEAEIASYATQEHRHQAATAALERAQLVADGVLWAYFAGSNARDRAARLAEVQQCVLAPGSAGWARLTAWRDALRQEPIGITPFHWELEFEDVFNRPDPGFDAIIGNPPFAGKNMIAAAHAAGYLDWLKTLHAGAHGNADLAAHFFRRAFDLLRRGGAFGLIATNTIRQGDTRDTGLTRILAEGGTIFRAVSRHLWEGEAAVVVAQVFVRKGDATTEAVLDDRPVRRISAYLMEGDLDGSPATLRANAGKAFQGSILLGTGFTFDDEGAAKGKASSLADLERLLADEPHASQIVMPFLGADEVSNSPRHAPHRHVINFGDMPLRRSPRSPRSWRCTGCARSPASMASPGSRRPPPRSTATWRNSIWRSRAPRWRPNWNGCPPSNIAARASSCASTRRRSANGCRARR